jgi:hypothetical protein
MLPMTANQTRYALAAVFSAACPDSLFDCIALTGSTARGFATADSDVEINFWVTTLPPLTERLAWAATQLQDIQAAAHPRSDGSIWISGTRDGIAVELGWQTWTDLAQSLERLLQAATTQHKELRLADLVISAQVLRGSGIAVWQERLTKGYPAALPPLLYRSVFGELAPLDWLAQQTEFQLADVWRVLFALNRRWEVNWKWARYIVAELPLQPPDFAEKVARLHEQNDFANSALRELWWSLMPLVKTDTNPVKARQIT